MNELIKEIEKRINVYHDRDFEEKLLEWVAERYPISEVYQEENWKISTQMEEIKKIIKGEK